MNKIRTVVVDDDPFVRMSLQTLSLIHILLGGVQAGHGVLEDHGNFLAAQLLHLLSLIHILRE